MKKKLKRFIHKYILGRKYYRSGQCACCGECCTHIYVRHAKDVIKTEEEFEQLKHQHSFYTYLKVIGVDETGLIFECQNLKEDKTCAIHNMRPGICRRYPQEEIFLMGGALKEGCGYKFTPIDSFETVLQKVKKKNKK